MRLYRFRVMIDDASEAFRDIAIKSEQTFLDLHKAIKNAFGFTGEEMACFYVSDDEWGKGPEIPLADLGFGQDGDEAPALMKDVRISDHMRSTRQRYLYVYDFLQNWTFMIELVHAGAPEKGKRYPQVLLSHGTPPGEFSRMDAALMPPEEEEDNMREEAEEVYDEGEGNGFGDEEEGDGDRGHGDGDDEGFGGHEELPEEYR